MKPELLQSGLALALRKARRAKGYTLRNAEKQTGVSSICRAESGQHGINLFTLWRLANCYERSLSDLLREAEDSAARQLALPL